MASTFVPFAPVQASVVFGGLHLGLLTLTVVLSVAVAWGLRRIRGTSAQGTTLRLSGWGLLVMSVFYTVWHLLPMNWTVGDPLPLHYSDILRFIAAVALITRVWWAVAITYFWGLTLNVQALATPHSSMLDQATVITVFYWVLHIAVVLAAVALIWGAGHRPQWRGFAVAYGAAIGWAAVLIPLNSVLGTNYGFLNRPPDGDSLIDVLGPWPVYVLWLALLVGLVWALMTWPWVRASRLGSARTSGTDEAPDSTVRRRAQA